MVIPVPIDTLYEMAERERIRVEWYPDPMCPRGRYMIVDGMPVIFLSPVLKKCHIRLRCTFTHELAHHFTGVTGPYSLDGSIRDDARANRWAQRFLLPNWWLIPRLAFSAAEIAEQSGVYQHWVEARLRDFSSMSMSKRIRLTGGGFDHVRHLGAMS